VILTWEFLAVAVLVAANAVVGIMIARTRNIAIMCFIFNVSPIPIISI
jgi:hypothetical protein